MRRQRGRLGGWHASERRPTARRHAIIDTRARPGPTRTRLLTTAVVVVGWPKVAFFLSRALFLWPGEGGKKIRPTLEGLEQRAKIFKCFSARLFFLSSPLAPCLRVKCPLSRPAGRPRLSKGSLGAARAAERAREEREREREILSTESRRHPSARCASGRAANTTRASGGQPGGTCARPAGPSSARARCCSRGRVLYN